VEAMMDGLHDELSTYPQQESESTPNQCSDVRLLLDEHIYNLGVWLCRVYEHLESPLKRTSRRIAFLFGDARGLLQRLKRAPGMLF
jgi:hypothetical protein